MRFENGKLSGTVKEFLEKEDKLDEVVFVLFTQKDLEIYEKTAKEIFKI